MHQKSLYELIYMNYFFSELFYTHMECVFDIRFSETHIYTLVGHTLEGSGAHTCSERWASKGAIRGFDVLLKVTSVMTFQFWDLDDSHSCP